MKPEYDHRTSLTYLRTSTYPELYKKSVEWQDELQRNGIAAHNHFADECTSDFACCTGLGDYHTYLPSYETVLKDHKTQTHD
jgi:hypothetical protein